MNSTKKLMIGGALGGLAPMGYSGGGFVGNQSAPTGEVGLSQKGLTFNLPTLTSHNHLGQNCSQNLLAKTKEDVGEDLLGCAVMKLDRYSNEKKMQFNSEVTIRYRDNGWIINTKIDNFSNETKFIYLITQLTWQDDSGTKVIGSFSDDNDDDLDSLYIKVPKNNGTVGVDKNSKSEHTSNESKEYKGGGISKDNQGSSGIFQNIEMGMDQQNYSEVFGDENASRHYIQTAEYINDEEQDGTGDTTVNNSVASKQRGNLKNTILSLIKLVKDKKGEWIDLDQVCSLKDKKNIDDEEQKKLMTYCSKRTEIHF